MTSKQFFIIVLFTSLTIIAWVIFDIIHARSQVVVPEETVKLTEPVNPNFDTTILNEL